MHPALIPSNCTERTTIMLYAQAFGFVAHGNMCILFALRISLQERQMTAAAPSVQLLFILNFLTVHAQSLVHQFPLIVSWV